MKPQPEAANQEVLAGLIERVTYHNVENGFCVLRAKARGHRYLVTVVGHAATIAAGEWITASGEWVNDRTHGISGLREVEWVDFGPLLRSRLLSVVVVWACGQRACVVHHVHTDVDGATCSISGMTTVHHLRRSCAREDARCCLRRCAVRYRVGSMQVRILSRR